MEAHVGDSRKTLGGSLKRAGLVRLKRRTFRAWEELVPRAVQRTVAFDLERELLRRGHQVAHRVCVHRVIDRWIKSDGETFFGRALEILQRDDCLLDLGLHDRIGRCLRRLECPLQQQRAFKQFQLDVHTSWDLQTGSVMPGSPDVIPGLNAKTPCAHRRRTDVGEVAVVALELGAMNRLVASWVGEDHRHAERIMTFASRGAAHSDALVLDGLGWTATKVDDWPDIKNRESPDWAHGAFRKWCAVGWNLLSISAFCHARKVVAPTLRAKRRYP